MSQRTQPPVVRSYLGELETALVGIPEDVARDILDGIAEELSVLDAAAAERRIEELGDPMFIAAAARAESGDPSGAAGALDGDADAGSRTESRGYVVFVSLLVAFGGVVVPFLGWIVGLALMWLSRRWRTWEKWIATVAVPAVALLIGAIGLAVLGSLSSGSGMSGFAGWHLLIILGVLGAGNVVAGLWLLWRGLRRAAPDPAASAVSAPAATTPRVTPASADAQWYIVLASLLVAFGGIVLPLLGWVFGIAMVWVSKTWRTWEKWTATLTAPLVTALTVVIARLLSVGLGDGSGGGLEDGVGFVSPGVPASPLFPAWYDAWWSSLLLMIALNVVVGIWLLWRGLRRATR